MKGTRRSMRGEENKLTVMRVEARWARFGTGQLNIDFFEEWIFKSNFAKEENPLIRIISLLTQRKAN